MNDVKLTAEQMAALAPFERHFTQATTAAWCSYPGQAGINLMLDTWHAVAGSPYPYKAGCPNCLLNLVRDLGTIYFAQKKAEAEAKVLNLEKGIYQKIEDGEPIAGGDPAALEKATPVAQEPAKPAKEGKTTAKGKNAGKRK